MRDSCSSIFQPRGSIFLIGLKERGLYGCQSQRGCVHRNRNIFGLAVSNPRVKKDFVSHLGFVVRRVNNFTRILSYDLSLVSVLIHRQRGRLVLEFPNRQQYLPHCARKGKLDDVDTTVTVGRVSLEFFC